MAYIQGPRRQRLSEATLKKINNNLTGIKVLTILALVLSFAMIPSVIFIGIIILLYLELEESWEKYIYLAYKDDDLPAYTIASTINMTVPETLGLYLQHALTIYYLEAEKNKKKEFGIIRAGAIFLFIIPFFWIGIILVAYGFLFYRPQRYRHQFNQLSQIQYTQHYGSFLKDLKLTREQFHLALGHKNPIIHFTPLKASFFGIFVPSGSTARKDLDKPLSPQPTQKEFAQQDIIEKQRRRKLEEIAKSYDKIGIEDLAIKLDFKNLFKAQTWLAGMANYYNYVIDGKYVIFSKEISDVMAQRPISKPVTYADLPPNQKEIIKDLRLGKALPLTQIVQAFDIDWFDIVPTLKPYLPKNVYITRINDLYRIVEPAPVCQISKTTITDIPYFQCQSCGRFLSKEHYADLKELGYAVCPTCGGKFKPMPITCTGCGVTFLDLVDMKELDSCRYCNYALIEPDVSYLTTSLSEDQLQELKQNVDDMKIKPGKQYK